MSQFVNEKCLRKDITKEESVQGYSDMAPTFESYLETIQYEAHMKCAEVMNELYPNKDGVKILDLACGTGLCAKEMKPLGFNFFDGVDPSDAMLKEAEKTGLYNKLICEYVGVEGQKLPLEEAAYDGVILIGGMGRNMIPCIGVHDMIRHGKPGAYLMMIFRQEILEHVEEYKDRLEPLFDSLEKEGKWKRVKRELYPRYQCDREGIIFIYQLC